MRSVTVSAPGKVILMGEHSAVYGHPALVAAFDLRLTVELHAGGPRDEVRLDLPQIGERRQLPWPAVLAYAREARRRWQRYAQEPGPATFAGMRGEDPAHLVLVALGEAADHLGEVAPAPLALALRSQIPLGAGFGSSAAAAVAVLSAYFALREAQVPAAELQRLAVEVERRQHGTPSGIDTAAVLHGGLLWCRRDASGELVPEPLAAVGPWLAELAVYHSGSPLESTGEVVAAVRARRQRDPEGVDAVLQSMATATEAFRTELAATPGDPVRLGALIRGFEAHLEELEVVPPALRQRIRRLEAAGAAAKISGAGALRGEGAGSLLVLPPAGRSAAELPGLEGLARFPQRLGAPGVRRHANAG